MKRKGEWFIIKVPIYDTFLFISIAQSDEDFKKCLKGTLGITQVKSFDGKNGGTYIGDDGDPFGIRLRHSPNTIEGKGTLNHELVHAVSRMLSVRGMRLSEDSEEAYAYLMSYLTKEIYKHL